ncbi:MAG TPA: ABC transporter substrate binding protein [Vicinamibacteria bacterium]|nr:ABC transporter substrate binding protein [Vicinamibacteria bacterium]
MITKVRVGSLLALALLSLGRPSFGAEVAVLKSTDAPAWKPALDALHRVAAKETISEFDLRGDRGEGERVLAGLKGKNVILVAMGNLAAQSAHDILPEVPLVFCMVQDPARLGLLGAANTTGVSFTIPVKNQLAAFRLVYPRGVRIGVIYDNENVGKQVQEAQKAAAIVRLILVERPVTTEKEIPEALRSLLKGQDVMDALWIPADPILLGDETRHFLLAETLKAAKPVYTFSNTLVQEGALVSNGPDYGSIGEQVGEIVERLAGGEKTKIEMMIPRGELVINKKIADKLKLEIPAEALRVANKVF